MAKRHIKKRGENYVYNWTPALAERSDMIECDAQGNPVLSKEVREAETPPPGLTPEESTSAPDGPTDPENPTIPPGAGAKSSTGTLSITAAELEKAERPQLVEIAESLKIDVHPNAKADTIRQKIKAKLYPGDEE